MSSEYTVKTEKDPCLYISFSTSRKERTLKDIGKTNAHHTNRRKGTRITLSFQKIATLSRRERSGIFKRNQWKQNTF